MGAPVGGEAATMVPPVGGRLVAFDSRVEHEVLPAHACRCRPYPTLPEVLPLQYPHHTRPGVNSGQPTVLRACGMR